MKKGSGGVGSAVLGSPPTHFIFFTVVRFTGVKLVEGQNAFIRIHS